MTLMTGTSASSVVYRSPDPGDYSAVRVKASRSFSDAFGQLYDAESFAEFLEHSYGAGGTMDRDLLDPAIEWNAAFHGPEPVGYSKLTPLRAPAPEPASGALELQQIYVLREWHGVASPYISWSRPWHGLLMLVLPRSI